MQDSAHFIEKLKNITVVSGDILISFDIGSLFTMIPVKEVLGYIEQLFHADLMALLLYFLITALSVLSVDKFYMELLDESVI